MNMYFGRKFKGYFVILIAFSLTACIHTANNDEEMLILSSTLTKLSKYVEMEVRYENPPEGISTNELLQRSTKHDPEILNAFTGYSIQIKNEDRHASILICTKDMERGLIEDVACTPQLDVHLWRDTSNSPCKFTLSINDICTN